jgi:hypothetical protein
MRLGFIAELSPAPVREQINALHAFIPGSALAVVHGVAELIRSLIPPH